jgi:hypothetical protein
MHQTVGFGLRLAALTAFTSLSACGGGGGAGSAAPRSPSLGWLATMRYEPTDIRVSLQTATLPFMYLDSGATNGAYPSPGAFRGMIEGANPSLLTGACSAITRMSAGVMQFTDAQGIAAPSYVVFFQPTAAGTCTQRVDLGADGVHSFTVTVTP